MAMIRFWHQSYWPIWQHMVNLQIKHTFWLYILQYSAAYFWQMTYWVMTWVYKRKCWKLIGSRYHSFILYCPEIHICFLNKNDYSRSQKNILKTRILLRSYKRSDSRQGDPGPLGDEGDHLSLLPLNVGREMQKGLG